MTSSTAGTGPGVSPKDISIAASLSMVAVEERVTQAIVEDGVIAGQVILWKKRGSNNESSRGAAPSQSHEASHKHHGAKCKTVRDDSQEHVYGIKENPRRSHRKVESSNSQRRCKL